MPPFRDRFLTGGCLGQFIHFGPYSPLGHGEQVLWRERRDQHVYAEAAMSWRPAALDVDAWCRTAVALGADYMMLTTRHHDGFCLWDSAATPFTSVRSAIGRDLVREYVEGCRRHGLRIGLYSSLAEWIEPAYFAGPVRDPAGWQRYRTRLLQQLRELLSNYGGIDLLWFDGSSPHSAADWGAQEILDLARGLQPGITINNRLGTLTEPTGPVADGGIGAGASHLGDFEVREEAVGSPDEPRPWETCATSTRRLWGWSGQPWRTAHEIAEEAIQVFLRGGNYLLNVGPDGDGRIPDEYLSLIEVLGPWFAAHRNALATAKPVGLITFANRGWLAQDGTRLLLILSSWDAGGSITLRDLGGTPTSASLLTTGAPLDVQRSGDRLIVGGLPAARPSQLYPVIAIHFAADDPPRRAGPLARRVWSRELSDRLPFVEWAVDGATAAHRLTP